MSEPQIPMARTATSASPGPAAGSGHSCQRNCRAPPNTRAFNASVLSRSMRNAQGVQAAVQRLLRLPERAFQELLVVVVVMVVGDVVRVVLDRPLAHEMQAALHQS